LPPPLPLLLWLQLVLRKEHPLLLLAGQMYAPTLLLYEKLVLLLLQPSQ
jgi:hypothetical protein